MQWAEGEVCGAEGEAEGGSGGGGGGEAEGGGGGRINQETARDG